MSDSENLLDEISKIQKEIEDLENGTDEEEEESSENIVFEKKELKPTIQKSDIRLTKKGKPDGRSKPRTEKQIANLRKMREAKALKRGEKAHIKALEEQKKKEIEDELETRKLKKQLKKKYKKKKYVSSSSSSSSSSRERRRRKKKTKKKRKMSSSSGSDVFKFDEEPASLIPKDEDPFSGNDFVKRMLQNNK